jgi:hypothetical protein
MSNIVTRTFGMMLINTLTEFNCGIILMYLIWKYPNRVKSV